MNTNNKAHLTGNGSMTKAGGTCGSRSGTLGARPKEILVGFLACILGSGCSSSRSHTNLVEPATPVPPVLLDVFPASTMVIPENQRGETIHSSIYTPTESKWGKGLNEADVFHYELKHEQHDDNSYRLRIGKGGQLYSLRGAFGESIPPQGKGNPWNDEVWQFVSVCGPYNGTVDRLAADGLIAGEELKKFRLTGYLDWYFIHNSGVYMQAPVDSGMITLSFDVMVDEETPGEFTCLMRDKGAPPWKTFGHLTMTTSGVFFNGTLITQAKAGGWYKLSLTFELVEADVNRGTVRVVTPEGEETEAEVAFAEGSIGGFGWIGLSASGSERGMMYVDNLAVKRETEESAEWLVNEDYEDYEAGLHVEGIVGANGEKDAIAVVTDRHAVSGRNSLEIRDAAGLDASWQPMVRKYVHSNLGRPLYCPLLGEDVPDDGRTFRSINWGLVPQLKTINRSPILYYVQTRDIGDGIIEVTYVVHNFSVRDDVVFEWLNAPWGGTRVTSLPYHYVSSPEGELWDLEKIEQLNIYGGIDVRKTGGWNLSCATESPDSPSLALVFGRDKHLEAELERAQKGEPHAQILHSIYRDWTSRFPGWEKLPEHAWRNYDVQVFIPRLSIKPGATIWYRSYLVINRKDRVMELAGELVDHVDYGLRVFDPETTPMVPAEEGPFELFAHPVPGSMPLFVIENATTGQEVVTTDPYIFVPQEEVGIAFTDPDHPKADYYRNAVGYSIGENNSNWKRLLGYGYREKPDGEGWVQLSRLLSHDLFPEATPFHLDLWVRERSN